MSIDAIKQELANLNVEHRNEIVAYLLAIDDQKSAEYRTALTRKVDDRNPDHWLTLEELDRRLSLGDKDVQAG
jgi:transcription elongation GreA/GreB family factor